MSDTVLFLISAKSNNDGDAPKVVDSWGKDILLSVLAQGLPASTIALTNLDNLPAKVNSLLNLFSRVEWDKEDAFGFYR